MPQFWRDEDAVRFVRGRRKHGRQLEPDPSPIVRFLKRTEERVANNFQD